MAANFRFIVYIDIRDHCIPVVKMQLFIFNRDWLENSLETETRLLREEKERDKDHCF